MALKLLPPNQVQFQTRARSEKDERRAVELQTLIVAKHKELEELEQTFADTLKRNQGVWASEEEAHKVRVQKLVDEVLVLEERKVQALLPLTERKKELDTIASALKEKEENLRVRETEIEERGDSLNVRLDEEGERELQCADRAATLSLQEGGLTLQREELRRMSEGFTEAMTRSTFELNNRDRALQLREAELKTKETQVLERERIAREKEIGFDARDRALKDAYETLERTKKRHG